VSPPDDLIGDLIAEVARTHGVAISRDDPVVAVVLLNQLVLRRYLEETLAPTTTAIRDATLGAIAQVEQVAQAQALWLDQVSLKDRASFLEDQKALHANWKAEMQALIEGQNAALQEVVLQTIAKLRSPGMASASVAASPESMPPSPTHRSLGPAPLHPWLWVAAGLLLGFGALVSMSLGAWVWIRVAGQ
jgi:hypothetical protein